MYDGYVDAGFQHTAARRRLQYQLRFGQLP